VIRECTYGVIDLKGNIFGCAINPPCDIVLMMQELQGKNHKKLYPTPIPLVLLPPPPSQVSVDQNKPSGLNKVKVLHHLHLSI